MSKNIMWKWRNYSISILVHLNLALAKKTKKNGRLEQFNAEPRNMERRENAPFDEHLQVGSSL